MKGTRPLLAAIVVIWAVVWLSTQALPASALGTAPTIGIGLVGTLVAVWGYPSVIGGPRRFRGLSAAPIEARLGDPLALVGRTMHDLREGLTDGAISQSATLLLPVTGGSEVQITDTVAVLGSAQAGASAGTANGEATPQSVGTEGHNNGELSPASAEAVRQGTSAWRKHQGGMQVATPLRVDDHIVGTLCVTFDDLDTPPLDRLGAVARLLSLYMEVGDLTQQAQLAADARLDALRAQINPHFLFNTLNTIASKSRTDPDEARHLLQRLADFFRYATQQEGQYAEFAQEYFFVRTYLSLEQARFSERLEVIYDIDPQVLPIQVPVLVIQPLVENAVKHGIAPQPKGGVLTLRARVDTLASSIRISVRDNGIGMAPELLADVAGGKYRSRSGGVGVRNIHERLDQLYGQRYQFDIRSSPGKGTRIELELPL